MRNNFFQPSVTINEAVFIEHYKRCISAIFNRVLAGVAASGLSPEDFLAINSKRIIDEVQAVKDNFMRMLSFSDEAYVDEFGIRLSKISLTKLHTFTHYTLAKGTRAGYN